MKDLTSLKWLFLVRTQITNAGLEHLQKLNKLERLYLTSCTGVSDAGLEHLKDLTSLELLNLLFCEGISDAGMKHLHDLNNLKSLSPIDTNVTLNGVNKLKQVLSNCDIAR